MATDIPADRKKHDDELRAKRESEKKLNASVNEQPVPMRRRRFLMINPADFLSMFTIGLDLAKRTRVITGAPKDAKVVNMTVDHVRGGIILVVESDEYDEIAMTDMPPVQLVEIRLGVDGATKKKKRK